MRWTDRQTDRIAMAKMRYSSSCCCALKNWVNVLWSDPVAKVLLSHKSSFPEHSSPVPISSRAGLNTKQKLSDIGFPNPEHFSKPGFLGFKNLKPRFRVRVLEYT